MEQTRITKVELDGTDGILVTFSDGTIAGYVAEELMKLRPVREQDNDTTDIIASQSPL